MTILPPELPWLLGSLKENKRKGLLSYLQIKDQIDNSSQCRRQLTDMQSSQHMSILQAISTQIATFQNLFCSTGLLVFSGHQLSLA